MSEEWQTVTPQDMNSLADDPADVAHEDAGAELDEEKLAQYYDGLESIPAEYRSEVVAIRKRDSERAAQIEAEKAQVAAELEEMRGRYNNLRPKYDQTASQLDLLIKQQAQAQAPAQRQPTSETIQQSDDTFDPWADATDDVLDARESYRDVVEAAKREALAEINKKLNIRSLERLQELPSKLDHLETNVNEVTEFRRNQQAQAQLSQYHQAMEQNFGDDYRRVRDDADFRDQFASWLQQDSNMSYRKILQTDETDPALHSVVFREFLQTVKQGQPATRSPQHSQQLRAMSGTIGSQSVPKRNAPPVNTSSSSSKSLSPEEEIAAIVREHERSWATGAA